MSSVERTGRRGTPGFTLIELLVALVVTGILATVILQLVQGQGRFVSLQSARAEVQQNSRGALELITSELRSLPPGAVQMASADSVRYRLPRAWGILCNVPDVGGGTVGVVFPDGTFPTDFPDSFTQPTGWGLAIPGDAGSYVPATLNAVNSNLGSCNAALGASAGSGVEFRQFSHGALPAAVTAPLGTAVFVFQQVQYQVARTTSPPGYWVRRRSGSGNFEPLAGPLLATSEGTEGLRFTYLCRTATGGTRPLTALELGNAATYTRINRIQVRVQMQSRSLKRATFDASAGQQTDTDSLTVALRNTSGDLACP